MWNGSTACSCFPCFRETVVVTCKCFQIYPLWMLICTIKPFLTYSQCLYISVESFLIHPKCPCWSVGAVLFAFWLLFFGNQISKMALIWKKRLFLTYVSHFLVTRESYKNSFSTHLKHIHARILLTLLTSFALPILKKMRIYQVWFLFGMSPGVDSYSRHFGTINK